MDPEHSENIPEARHRFFEQEVVRLMDRLYGVALRLTRNPDDAEDVVAETVAKAWAGLDSLNDASGFEGWIFRILNNTFISAWRHRRYRQGRETSVDDLAPDTVEGDDGFSLFEKLHQPFLLWWGSAEDQFLNDLLHEDLQHALDALPDSYRIAIILVEVQGYTYQEVADLLDIPIGTVRSRLNRGRATLQKILWSRAREAGLTSCGMEHDDESGGRS